MAKDHIMQADEEKVSGQTWHDLAPDDAHSSLTQNQLAGMTASQVSTLGAIRRQIVDSLTAFTHDRTKPWKKSSSR